MPDAKIKTVFDNFTRKYALSKTLKFELKPVPRTRKLLNLGNKNSKTIFLQDKVRAENYAIIKEYVDKLHANFINKALALSGAYIDVTKIKNEKQEDVSDEQEIDNDGKGKEEKFKSNHHKKIIELFKEIGTKDLYGWIKFDKKNIISGKLFGKELIDILREEFKNELDKEIDIPVLFFNKDEKRKKRKLKDVFSSFGKNEKKEGKNFTTYFTSAFHDNRKNYYKGDGKTGRVATRIVDENLKRFLLNKEKFENILKSADGDSEEIKKIRDKEKSAKLIERYRSLLKSFDDCTIWDDFMTKKAKRAELPKDFDYKNWRDYAFGNKYGHFLQKKINAYNFIKGKLNKDINESKIDIGNFQKLHKQVHGEAKKLDTEEEFYVDKDNIFAAENSFIKRFIVHSQNKLRYSQKIFDRFLKEEYSKPEQVFISKRAVNTISSRCFANWNTLKEAIRDNYNEREKKQNKDLPQFVDLLVIKDVLESEKDTPKDELFKYKYFEAIDPKNKDRKRLQELQINLEDGKHWHNFLLIMKYEFDSLKKRHEQAAVKLLIEKKYDKVNNKQQIGLLFDFAESANGLMSMTKYFALRRKGVMVEDSRYSNRDEIHEMAENYLDGSDDGTEGRCFINEYYKALKHFVSQKPWIEDKVVLTFENPVLLGGWNQTKEMECGGILLERSGCYYLGYLENKKTFDYSFNENDLYSNGKESKKKKAETLEKNWQERLKRFQKARAKNGEEFYNKIEIFQIADAHHDVSLLRSRATKYNLKKFDKFYKDQGGDPNKIDDIKENNSYKTTEKNFNLNDLKTIVDYYKACLPAQDLRRIDEYNDVSNFEKAIEQKGYSNWRFFDFSKLSITDSYKNINGFTNELERCGYRVDTVKISKNYIDEAVKNGDLYLFQIYNKDFELDEEIGKEKHRDKFVSKKEWRQQKDRREEEKEHGRENEHTTFFKMLFDQEKNLRNKDGVIYKLSGGAKLFYRPASKDLKNKEDQYGKKISERQRYSEDKLMLHIPILMNFVNKNEERQINSDINKLIYDTGFKQDKFRIIALDRGEKNLVYLTVLNEQGKILQAESLNHITRFDKNGKPKKEKNQYHDKNGNPKGEAKINDFKDYHNLLEQKQIERLKARKSWEPVEKIANLKEGYLGFVANKIASLVVDFIQDGKIPVIVLENLNVGMKQGRIQIEKQVYSKVEEKIAKKLSYLVDKRVGNFLNAWQLTPNIKTFGSDIEWKDQVGIIFYVNPSYTSATCPKCGFRKRKYIKAEKAKDEFKKVEMSFDGARYIFKFSSEVTDTVYSNVRRVIWDKKANEGRGGSKEIDDVTKEMTKLFKDFGMSINNSISGQIQQLELSKGREKEFWGRLLKWFNYILEIRNSINKKRRISDENAEIEEWGENKDFIFCPHCYFDSEKKEAMNNLKEKIYIGDEAQKFEFNGDANGSYNIGRKGIIGIQKIKAYEQEKIDFQKKWNITDWPKSDKNNDKISLSEGLFLQLVKLKEKGINNKKEAYYYCVLSEGIRLKPNEKTIEYFSVDKRLRKYPDLFISDSEWDKFVQNKQNLKESILPEKQVTYAKK